MDGRQLAEKLKSRPATAATSVILLASKADISEKLAMHEPVDDLLEKPFFIKDATTRINYLGGNLGGPLSIPHVSSSKNKMFFFVSGESIGELRPKGQQQVTVPTLLERQGDFSQSGSNAKPVSLGGTKVTIKDPQNNGAPFPGNLIPQDRIIPSLQNYLKLFPAPNFDSPADGLISKGAYNYVYQESLHVPKWLNSARLDYNATEKTQFFARFNYWYEDQQGSAAPKGWAGSVAASATSTRSGSRAARRRSTAPGMANWEPPMPSTK